MVWRIRDRATFEALRKRGRRGRQGPVTVTFLADPVDAPVQPPRVAYAVNKRVGNAVVRNRTRRRLRAAIDQVSLPSGAYLVGVTPSAASLSFDQLLRELESAVRLATKPRPDRGAGRG